MKVLVTGANGFLGSHITRYLVKQKHEILALSPNSYRLDDVMDKIQYASFNMNNLIGLRSRILFFKPEVVIHAAWEGGNKYIETQNSKQFYKNLPGTADLMEICKEAKIRHFIGIGSAAEYGNYGFQRTEQIIASPTSLYGVCKLMTNLYTQQYCKNENITWTWVRPFYVYGPGDVESRLVPSTIKKCLKKQEVPLNECDVTIDLLYIDDFVKAVYELMAGRVRIASVVNVCSGQSYKVREVVNIISEKTENEKNIQFGALPERVQQSNVIGSNSLITNKTGWRPLVGLHEGLSKTIKYYKEL